MAIPKEDGCKCAHAFGKGDPLQAFGLKPSFEGQSFLLLRSIMLS